MVRQLSFQSALHKIAIINGILIAMVVIIMPVVMSMINAAKLVVFILLLVAMMGWLPSSASSCKVLDSNFSNNSYGIVLVKSNTAYIRVFTRGFYHLYMNFAIHDL